MPDPSDAIRALAARLGHAFRDLALLETALTHRSYVHEHPELGCRDNERLEFVGDSIVNAAAAMLLFEHFPDAKEGELTRRRADLVNERALAQIAAGLGLGEALRLGRGEERSGGRSKPRLLACALEACIAAIFLDAGIDAALGVARSLLEPKTHALAPGEHDYKTHLQELFQAWVAAPPRYEVERTEGPEHARIFHVRVEGPDGTELARGSGRTKLEAEQQAARAALARLEPGGSEHRAEEERA
jgi:ribonuclease-3